MCVHIHVYIYIYIYIYIWGTTTPGPRYKISRYKTFAKGWVAQKHLLIGNYRSGVRLSKGWVRKDENLITWIGCSATCLIRPRLLSAASLVQHGWLSLLHHSPLLRKPCVRQVAIVWIVIAILLIVIAILLKVAAILLIVIAILLILILFRQVALDKWLPLK